MLDGYKTYVGIIVTLAGSFGVTNLVSSSDLTTTLNTIVTLVGAALALYGRYAAKPK